MNEEHYLLAELGQGNKEAFSLLFRKYYKDMVLFGGNYLYDKTRCEDIVQTIFAQLWENRETLVIETSLKSFLLRSVRNGCIDELRHRQSIREHESYTEAFGPLGDLDTENYILYSDLQAHLDEALDKLPEAYKQAFVMNRFDGLKYKEIALKLEISERTVEVRIGKAIGLLRHHLKDFLILILVILSLNKL
ncbi:RNA polymerase sigma-70 factor [Microbacter margulisiae]|uniref:RNA polymerase sigma-70 factor (ECF subfamily) n=1 Tax=Microbacter margulisiae TaxID=1350067 RepID=A0A7W5DT21_9PORP|nr:RNA polymerase sigma-70 factor [Microbacter margulisiae]MBB3188527.1 RNA polymerase sigma-70 factor (ECF subfamily) [Microbacter margulisiae]